MEKIFLFFSFLLLILIGCTHNNSLPREYVTVPVNYHDAITAIDTQIVNIRSVQYIPLKGQNGVVGEISQMIVRENFYVLLDKQQKCVWQFDSDGRFMNLISRQGKGPEEYRSIDRIALTPDEQVYVIGYDNPRILIYDLNGKYLKSKFLRYCPLDFVYADSVLYSLYYYIPETSDNKEKFYLHINNEKKNEQRDLLRYNKSLHEGFYDNLFSLCKEEVFLNMPLNNTIYQIVSGENLKRAYFFDFGPEKYPNKALMKIEKEDEKEALIGGRAFQGKISKFIISKDYLTFQYAYTKNNINKVSNVIYNRGTGKFINYNGLVWQGLYSDLPYPIAADDNYFYSILFSYQISKRGVKYLESKGVEMSGDVFIIKFKYKV
jgi:hypothetical protein